VEDVCAYAAKHGVTVTIEPINRFEGYTGFMNSVSEASKIIAMLGIENLEVLGDTFHMNIEDTSLSDALRTAGPKLRHIHLNDSNRLIPGTGHVDFVEVLKTLKEIDFQGYMLLDCLPVLPDLETYLGAIDYMKRIESVIELQEQFCDLKVK
jgi:sugar phosphate isomerase/epimerase